MDSDYNRVSHFWKRIYGMDFLSSVLVMLAMICLLLSWLLPSGRFRFLIVPACILLLICGWRFFSVRVEHRRRENEVFWRFAAPVMERLTPPDEGRKEEKTRKREKKQLAKEEKLLLKEQEREFRFFDCPMCKQKLRVPRGNGKVEITCPNCGNRFIRKT